MWQLSENFKQSIQAYAKNNTLIKEFIDSFATEPKRETEKTKQPTTPEFIDALIGEAEINAIFWLTDALSKMVRTQNKELFDRLSELLTGVFDKAKYHGKTATLINAFYANGADQNKTNAINCLADALNQAAYYNNTKQIHVILSKYLADVFETAQQAKKTPKLLDALLDNKADINQMNAIFSLAGALNHAARNKNSEQANIATLLADIFEKAQATQEITAFIDALCAKKADREQAPNAVFSLMSALNKAMQIDGNQDVRTILLKLLTGIFSEAQYTQKNAALLDALFTPRCNPDQTHAIFCLVNTLNHAVLNNSIEQASISKLLIIIFDKAKESDKTAELINALCSNRTNDDQTNALFWLMNALKKMNNVKMYATIAKAIIELVIYCDTASAPKEEFKNFIFTHKEILKEAIILRVKETKDTGVLKNVTAKSTLLGQLIDYNTSSISAFFSKETSMRKEINALITEKEKIAQGNQVRDQASGALNAQHTSRKMVDRNKSEGEELNTLSIVSESGNESATNPLVANHMLSISQELKL